MKIYIDALTVPNSVTEICRKTGNPIIPIREREKDLYKLSSEDLEKEIKIQSAIIEKNIEEATTGDILVTRDLDVAREFLNRFLTVLHPNGFVFTQRSILRLDYEHFRLVQNESNEDLSPIRIKNRNEKLDEKFSQSLQTILKGIEF